jgi:hypothetical protein
MNKPISISLLVLALIASTAVPRTARAQDGAGLIMSTDVLRQIAIDFDQGRNPFYCYFGVRSAATPDQVRVDSVTTVTKPTDCAGNGLGFVSRVEDRFFLVNALKGLIEAMPRFLVVSAFYRTEDVERDGRKVHAAHALSIIRGVGTGVAAAGANGRT